MPAIGPPGLKQPGRWAARGRRPAAVEAAVIGPANTNREIKHIGLPRRRACAVSGEKVAPPPIVSMMELPDTLYRAPTTLPPPENVTGKAVLAAMLLGWLQKRRRLTR